MRLPLTTDKRRALAWGAMLATFGATATIAQAVYIRETLVVFFGSELTLGVTMASWLVGVFLGAAVGGFVTDRVRRPVVWLAGTLIALSLLLPTCIWLIRSLRGLWGLDSEALPSLWQIAVGSAGLISPTGFSIGFAFPLASRVGRDARGEHSAVGSIGLVYVLEALGSFIGGLAFSFVLVEAFTPFAIACMAGALLLATLALAVRDRGISVVAVLLAMGFVLALLGPVGRIDRASIERRWQGFAPVDLVESVDSRYQNIAVGRHEDQYTLYTNGRLAATWPDPSANQLTAMMLYAQHPGPRRALLLGGGYEGLASQLARYPLHDVCVVSLDPRMAATTRRYLSDDARKALSARPIVLRERDARRFVQFQTGRDEWHLVYVNVGDPATAMINRYYTVEFFRHVRAIMSGRGTVALEVTGAPNFVGGLPTRYVACLRQTLARVFKHVLVIPGDRCWLFASDMPNAVTADVNVLAERYTASGADPAALAALFRHTLIPSNTADVNRYLAGLADVPVNTDTRPVAYWIYLEMQDRFRAGSLVGWFDLGAWLAGPPLWWLAGALGLVVLVVGWSPITSRARRLRWLAVWAILTTGLVGMALEIVLVYAYQNVCGYVYRDIGMLVGVFMLGLTLAGAVTTRRSRRSTTDRGRLGRLVAVQVAMACWCFVLLWLAQAIVGGGGGADPQLEQCLLTAGVFVTGMLTGAAFPLAAAVDDPVASGVGSTAGAIDAADHLGAAVGALVTGALLVPLVGYGWTCTWLAVLVLTSVVGLLGLAMRSR